MLKVTHVRSIPEEDLENLKPFNQDDNRTNINLEKFGSVGRNFKIDHNLLFSMEQDPLKNLKTILASLDNPDNGDE